jgi:2-aminoadipate transaminase
MVNWNKKFAGRTKHMKRSSIREILKLTQRPDIISFAGGLPAPELFPVDHIKEATDIVLSERGREALQYSMTEGMPELRDLLAQRMSSDKITLTRENVVIVSGAQQSLDLIGRVMLDEEDTVVAENPTYLGALQAWAPYNLNYLTIPTDENGLLVDYVEDALKKNPKMLYFIPTFQNPQGVTMSLERRIQLAKLLGEYGALLVEDNPYGELRYSGEHLPGIYELDAENLGINTLEGHVVYAGTFSKLLTPGLRIGWVAGPKDIIDKIVQAKQSADLHTSTFAQMVTYQAASDGFLDKHIANLREVYRERRDVMLAALDEHFPKEATWAKPEGGLFLMVYLPEGIDATELLKKAIEYKVAYVPGGDFHLGGGGKNSMRLNFSNAQPDMIREGIKRLGKLIKEAMKS